MEEDKREVNSRPGFLRGVATGIILTLVMGTVVFGSLSVVHYLRHINSAAGNSSNASSEAEKSDSLSEGADQFYDQLESKMDEINRLIDDTFIFDVDSQALMDQALAGYVSGLDDPYSAYYTQEEYEKQMEESDGSYVGIGVSVQQDMESMIITVMTVYPGSPAEEGGMEKGDVIIGVDGQDINQMSLSEVVALIQGEENTQVKVQVLRDGGTKELTMTRRSIDKITVESRMLDEAIGYIQLSEFDKVSISQMEEAVLDLEDQGMESLVLDLRDNPGGLLTSVLSIADYFLPETNIFYSEDKSGKQTRYDAEAGQLFDGEMAILVNGNSASAAEVLSGSLQDNGRAVLVGEQTFGKGIVQSYYNLSDGSALKLTTAHYFTPSGRDIHGVGIEPDIVVEPGENDSADNDTQLNRAVDYLKELKPAD
ncbi:MAG: S41 family peptidase [Clostridiales bacterium]|nr:S41 family peptidase [Clostridiales bacterium]